MKRAAEPRALALALSYPTSIVLPALAALAMAVWIARAAAPGWLAVLAAGVAGLFLWTLVEYFLHRFLLHSVEPFRRWHVDHHVHPERPIRIPLLFSVALVLVLVAVPLALAPGRAGAALALGLLLGHIAQESVHARLHGPPAAAGSWLEQRRLAHQFHHERDDTVAFGTLSGLWDSVFGSSIRHRGGR